MTGSYVVVELAGYQGENDRAAFHSSREAWAWIARNYDADERDPDSRDCLHVDVRLDTPDGGRTYDHS